MSGGHLCEAEAPTEPTGETAAPYEKLKYNSVGAGLCACPLLLLIIGFFRVGEGLRALPLFTNNDAMRKKTQSDKIIHYILFCLFNNEMHGSVVKILCACA